jgi:hypothetical protein
MHVTKDKIRDYWLFGLDADAIRSSKLEAIWLNKMGRGHNNKGVSFVLGLFEFKLCFWHKEYNYEELSCRWN